MANADRIIQLFHEAKSRPVGAERDRFIADHCRDDAERNQVLALLQAQEQAGDFLNVKPALASELEEELARLKPEEAGDRIGPYKLREQIGEGGFGVVWVAEQLVPVRRTVALKIIKLGMDTKEVVARFEQERQALALMDHPNIAKVLDAGATEHGRPFFVMELVRGIKITDYCDQASLPTADRLALFIQVCHAVQHAHQKGIIHRDLKPSNILVTLHDGVPVPKVIDFGVAKATQGRIVEHTIYTQFQQMIGTPLYMSPEQAEMSGLDVDTRTDIYALGVLLYELLTGRTPFDADRLMKVGHDEMRRVIREEEPPKPSTALDTMAQEKLTAVAQHRSSEPPKLIHAIHGDLDWIVMKALEKDRRHRYENASSLATDIQRHLANEPISACPPSAIYRFRKFARRNRGTLAIATVASVAVLLALIGLAVSNVLITQEKNQKVAALEQAKINEETANTQRGIAERNAVKAREQEKIAEANEKQAKASELLARRRYYAAQMNLAMQAWQSGEAPRVLELLEGQRPKPDEEDLRGFEWFYLWKLCRGGRRVPISGHKGAVLDVAFSPDGKTLVSVSWDRTVRLWDTATGKEQKVLHCNHGPWEVVFSPDGKTLASSGQEAGWMILWDVASGAALHTIAGSVMGARFTPDSKSIVGSHRTATGMVMKEWDVVSGQERVAFADNSIVIGLSPDRRTLLTATGLADKSEVRIWDWPSGKHRLSIPLGLSTATSSPDCSQVAIATWGAVNLYDVRTGEPIISLRTGANVRKLAYSPDGKRIAVGLEDRRVMVFDVASGKLIAEDLHLDPVWGVAFSPDGKLLASSTLAGAINLWDTTPAQEAKTITDIPANPGDPAITDCSLRFTPEGSALVVGYAGMTKVIDVATGKEVALLPVRDVASISANAGVLARRSGLENFDIWDAQASRKTWTVPVPKITVRSPAPLLSHDGSMLFSYTIWADTSTVKLWDLARQQPKALDNTKPPHGMHSVMCADFSSDGKLLATGHHFYWVTLHDVATGSVIKRFAERLAMVVITSVKFSPNAQLLAVGTDVGAVTIWDVQTGKQLVACRGHATEVNALDFSPDGRVLATAGNDKTVRLWDVATGQERGTLTGHTSAVTNVSFSPDGFTLATASNDKTVKLWRGATDSAALAPRGDVPGLHTGPIVLPPGAIELREEKPAGDRKTDALITPAEVTKPSQGSFEFHRDRSAVLREQGKLPEAVAELRKAIELSPDQTSLHFRLGELLAEQKKSQDALAAFQKAIRLEPSHHLARVRVAWTLFELSKFAEAETEFRELIRVKPGHFDGYFGLGRALVSQKKDASAVEPLLEAIRLSPNHAGPHGTLGWAYMKLEKFPEAEAELREQIRLSPRPTPSAYRGLGIVLGKQGKHDESIVALRESLRIEPKNPQTHDLLGWAFLATSEPAKAEAEFREMIRLMPELASGHWGLGRALMDQQKHAEAETAFREAIRLEPAHSQAADWLRKALAKQGKVGEAEAPSDKKPGKNQSEPDERQDAR